MIDVASARCRIQAALCGYPQICLDIYRPTKNQYGEPDGEEHIGQVCGWYMNKRNQPSWTLDLPGQVYKGDRDSLMLIAWDGLPEILKGDQLEKHGERKTVQRIYDNMGITMTIVFEE